MEREFIGHQWIPETIQSFDQSDKTKRQKTKRQKKIKRQNTIRVSRRRDPDGERGH